MQPKGLIDRKSIISSHQKRHPTIDYYFDAALHIVKRSKELAWESKELVAALLMLILLIKHSFHVLW
jgi:hypothetical protein